MKQPPLVTTVITLLFISFLSPVFVMLLYARCAVDQLNCQRRLVLTVQLINCSPLLSCVLDTEKNVRNGGSRHDFKWSFFHIFQKIARRDKKRRHAPCLVCQYRGVRSATTRQTTAVEPRKRLVPTVFLIEVSD